MKFVLDGDLVLGKGDGDFIGIPVAAELAASDLRNLRFDGERVFDASSNTQWFVDASGRKRLDTAPDRFAMVAGIHDAIEPDGAGGWRVVGLAPQLLKYAADLRWRREVGGILVGTVPVATDDRSKLMITGARVAAAADSGWSTVWHGSDGQTYPVGAAAMIAISDAVQAHVNASFATFATVKAAIEAGEITSTAEIDAAFEAAQ